MKEKTKEAFRAVLEELIDIEIDNSPHILRFPRVLFSSAVHILKRGQRFSQEEYKEFLEQFLTVLNEKNVRVENKAFLKSFRKEERRRKKNHGRPDWVTDRIMAGAVRADFRHRQMLGDDY